MTPADPGFAPDEPNPQDASPAGAAAGGDNEPRAATPDIAAENDALRGRIRQLESENGKLSYEIAASYSNAGRAQGEPPPLDYGRGRREGERPLRRLVERGLEEGDIDELVEYVESRTRASSADTLQQMNAQYALMERTKWFYARYPELSSLRPQVDAEVLRTLADPGLHRRRTLFDDALCDEIANRVAGVHGFALGYKPSYAAPPPPALAPGGGTTPHTARGGTAGGASGARPAPPPEPEETTLDRYVREQSELRAKRNRPPSFGALGGVQTR
jgi:hypothetical protein